MNGPPPSNGTRKTVINMTTNNVVCVVLLACVGVRRKYNYIHICMYINKRIYVYKNVCDFIGAYGCCLQIIHKQITQKQ